MSGYFGAFKQPYYSRIVVFGFLMTLLQTGLTLLFIIPGQFSVTVCFVLLFLSYCSLLAI